MKQVNELDGDGVAGLKRAAQITYDIGHDWAMWGDGIKADAAQYIEQRIRAEIEGDGVAEKDLDEPKPNAPCYSEVVESGEAPSVELKADRAKPDQEKVWDTIAAAIRYGRKRGLERAAEMAREKAEDYRRQAEGWTRQSVNETNGLIVAMNREDRDSCLNKMAGLITFAIDLVTSAECGDNNDTPESSFPSQTESADDAYAPFTIELSKPTEARVGSAIGLNCPDDQTRLHRVIAMRDKGDYYELDVELLLKPVRPASLPESELNDSLQETPEGNFRCPVCRSEFKKSGEPQC